VGGPPLGDVPLEEFREQGRRLVDWIARYLGPGGADALPVLSRVRPGEVRAQIPAAPPAQPEPLAAILQDVERVVVPGLTHWNHPGFLAYFANSSPAPAVLAEMLSAAFNANGMLWKTAPAATEVELATLDWLRQMLGLDAGMSGVIHDTASVSTLVALAGAREAVPGLDVRRTGLSGLPRLRMYASDQAHSSVDKAGMVLGIGQEGLRHIASDSTFRMDPRALAAAVREDRAAGWLPFAVTATVGTTSSTSVDPVAEVARVCADEGLWLHVDASYAGSAAVVPELRWVLDGCQGADSLVVNPHKWMFVPIDLSVLFTRRPEVLRKAFSLVPEFLRTPEDALAPNLMDYGVSLGRRFRALKLWMVVRAFGVDGIAARIREHVRLAQVFRGWVEQDPAFEVSAPSPLSVVCFRARCAGLEPAQADARNEALMEAVNGTGETYLSHTRLNDRTVLRVAVGNIRTEERHLRRAWELLQLHSSRMASA